MSDPCRPIIDAETQAGKIPQRRGIYVASKAHRAQMWLDLRNQGVPIISTWIDEAGPGESGSLSDLAFRCVSEAAMSGAFVMYCEPHDVLKGALIEAGAALAAGVHVYSCGFADNRFTSDTFRSHPLWHEVGSLSEAIEAALSRIASPTPELDLMRRKAAAFDKLARIVEDNYYRHDVMLQSDPDDGVWVSLRDKGMFGCFSMDHSEDRVPTLLEAVERAKERK